MKSLSIFIIIFSVMVTFFTKNLKADPGSGNKSAELNTQIVQEVKKVLGTPFLKFADKNLNGEVYVNTSVNKEGKIVFTEVKGLNENLKESVISKLNTLNLWTSPDYRASRFIYKIKYKN